MGPSQEGMKVTRRGSVIRLVKQKPGGWLRRLMRPPSGGVGETSARIVAISRRSRSLRIALKLLLPPVTAVASSSEARTRVTESKTQ